MGKSVGLLLHSDLATVEKSASELRTRLLAHDVAVVELEGPDDASQDLDLIVVLGGDGTMLRAAEVAHQHNLPLLGVNLGRVGFLAEAESSDLETVAQRVANGDWQLESRITLDLSVVRRGSEVWQSFALNEVAIEKSDHALMTELRVAVSGTPVMALAGDGLIVSTPTGSTAYAFSAGGPVIWPTADVLEVAPICAHALFARPLVVDPSAVVEIEVLEGPAAATCDGRRMFELEVGDRLRVVRGKSPLEFARLAQTPFTDRLVAKFQLPTEGWRARRDTDA